MKFQLHNLIAAAALVAVLPVQAADTGKTREQVKAEYEQAVRAGDIVEGWSLQKFNELYPAAYPAKSEVAKARAEQKAETAPVVPSGKSETKTN